MRLKVLFSFKRRFKSLLEEMTPAGVLKQRNEDSVPSMKIQCGFNPTVNATKSVNGRRVEVVFSIWAEMMFPSRTVKHCKAFRFSFRKRTHVRQGSWSLLVPTGHDTFCWLKKPQEVFSKKKAPYSTSSWDRYDSVLVSQRSKINQFIVVYGVVMSA